jgi:hypothetical protein
MPKLRFPGSALVGKCVAMAALVICGSAQGQHTYIPDGVRVSDLPRLMARSQDPSDVLLTSLDTILRDREVCCGKDSALEDSAQRADPASLKDVAAKLQGRHLLSDGRPIMVTAQYIASDAINGYLLIETLQKKHAMLMLWKARLYVLYGATYLEDYDPNSGTGADNVTKLQLIDTRYSDARRNVEFNRATDDWTQVQGVLWITAVPQ